MHGPNGPVTTNCAISDLLEIPQVYFAPEFSAYSRFTLGKLMCFVRLREK